MSAPTLSTFRIFGPRLVANRQDTTIDAVKTEVETTIAPLKKGWRGQWVEHPNGHVWGYLRWNSRGTMQPGEITVTEPTE